ncbi:Origin recognition complex subunit 3 [Basidiobolus ranarum]|uniref:Origin recognition complex subunit 3 n=1 Tax=Basidiobolus ranarum TaxID=34480 RepID=A0ABR2WA48_9FUNG
MRRNRELFESDFESCTLIHPPQKKECRIEDGVSHFEFEGFRKLLGGREAWGNVKFRYQRYLKTWSLTKNKIEYTYAQYNCYSVRKLYEFTQNSNSNTKPLRLPVGFITTEYIEDNEFIMNDIAKNLREKHRTLVATIDLSYLLDTTTAIKTIIGQFESSPNKNELLKKFPTSASTNLSLTEWYKRKVKTKKKNNGYENLVVLINAHPSDCCRIEEFLGAFKSSLGQIPLSVLICTTVPGKDLVSNLTSDLAKSLYIEDFSVPNTTKFLGYALEEIFIFDPNGFKLGLGPFKLLIDLISNQKLSIRGFSNHIKYSVMTQYYSNPLCIFSLDKDDFPDMHMISDDHLEILRMQPSFRRYLECIQDGQEVIRLLEDDDYMISRIPDFIKEFEEHNIRYYVGIKCVSLLQDAISARTFKKPLYLLYLEGLSSNLSDARHIKLLLTLLNAMKNEALCTFLKQFQEFLSTTPQVSDIFKNDLEELTKLNESSQKDLMENEDGQQENGEESVIHRVHDFCARLLRESFICYEHMPLYELFYFSNREVLEWNLNPDYLKFLKSGMEHPSSYINCNCCNDEFSPTQHDTCILYKIYSESSESIFLDDWYFAFQGIANQQTTYGEPELRARFNQSFCEFQFLGLVQPIEEQPGSFVKISFPRTKKN